MIDVYLHGLRLLRVGKAPEEIPRIQRGGMIGDHMEIHLPLPAQRLDAVDGESRFSRGEAGVIVLCGGMKMKISRVIV